jgi:tRNA(Ile)-lysidine synthase
VSDRAKQIESFTEEFIRRERLVSPGDSVLVAVSGGQDSMALLAILHRLAPGLQCSLQVAHFDHMLREESERDMQVVERMARDLGVPFHCGRSDVRKAASESGDTIEEAARKARYRYLRSTAEKTGASRIAVGHTRDDQVETVLMRILWGSGIRGLAGIPCKRDKLIRPLIHASREDTRRYCIERGIPFVSDPSNRDKRFMRNRIRLELIPLLKSSFHPGVEENILNLCSNARTLLESIRRKTRPALESALRKEASGELVLDIAKIRELDDTSLFVLLGDVFSDYLGCDMDFTKIHYMNLFDLMRREGASGKSLSLPGLTVRREYDELVITRAVPAGTIDAGECVKLSSLRPIRKGLKVPGTTKAGGVTIKARVIPRESIAPGELKATGGTAFFSLDKITPPVILRTPEPGDRMRPFGMKGSKKLSDIFTDRKIPARRRAGTFVIADAREIIWLVGVATSESFRVTPSTRNVLKITVTRE